MKTIIIITITKSVFIMANSADPDETRRLIWVYAVCICSFFVCIQPVPQVCTVYLYD